MTKVARPDFIKQRLDARLDLATLKANPTAVATLEASGTTVATLSKADLDKNGYIAGDAELRAVFAQIDHFDNDGAGSSFDITDKKGKQTAAGKVFAAIDPNFSSARLAVAKAALDLVASSKQYYGVDAEWKSPNPGIPGNANPGSTAFPDSAGRWKCNLFGGDALYKAGFVPPTYAGNGRGWYSVAVDFHNFTTGTKPIFKGLGSIDLNGITDEGKKADAVNKLLAQAQPGDFIMVTHQGGAGRADGGHTRVVVGTDFANNGTVTCAQASFNEAVVRVHNVNNFTGEQAMYLLRPVRQRVGTAAALGVAPADFTFGLKAPGTQDEQPRWEGAPSRDSDFAKSLE